MKSIYEEWTLFIFGTFFQQLDNSLVFLIPWFLYVIQPATRVRLERMVVYLTMLNFQISYDGISQLKAQCVISNDRSVISEVRYGDVRVISDYIFDINPFMTEADII